MPIRPENRHRYPDNWDEITARLKAEVDYQCEGSPKYPECRAAQGWPHPVTGSIVVLTVGHLNHMPEDNRRENQRVWCQRCHLAYDAVHHARTRSARARRQEGRNGSHA